MSDADEFAQRAALERIDRLITNERMAAVYSSDWSEQLAHAIRTTDSVSPLHPSPVVDTVEYVTSVLRDIFRQHPTYRWLGNPDGTNNVRGTKILISSMYALQSEQGHQSIPSIRVLAQMSMTPTTSLGHLAHVRPGFRAYAGVHMVSVQLRVEAKRGAEAASIAHFLSDTLRINSTEWCNVRWQNIRDISVTTFDERPENISVGRPAQTSHSRAAVTSFVVAVRWSAVKGTSLFDKPLDDIVLGMGSIDPELEKVDGHAQEDVSMAADPEDVTLSVPYEQ